MVGVLYGWMLAVIYVTYKVSFAEGVQGQINFGRKIVREGAAFAVGCVTFNYSLYIASA